jgi:hypothetical protein
MDPALEMIQPETTTNVHDGSAIAMDWLLEGRIRDLPTQQPPEGQATKIVKY